jgi:hypothetical protein
MNPNRNASALPGRGGSQADHATQQEIIRRTPNVGPGFSILHTHAGPIIERTRKFIAPRRHQWKATANGDDTIRISAGKLFYPQGSADPVLMNYLSQATEDVTVTADGFIYYKALFSGGTVIHEDISLGSDTLSIIPSSGSLEFVAGALPTPGFGDIGSDATYKRFPIAEVNFADDVATVADQIAEGPLYWSTQYVQAG